MYLYKTLVWKTVLFDEDGSVATQPAVHLDVSANKAELLLDLSHKLEISRAVESIASKSIKLLQSLRMELVITSKVAA